MRCVLGKPISSALQHAHARAHTQAHKYNFTHVHTHNIFKVFNKIRKFIFLCIVPMITLKMTLSNDLIVFGLINIFCFYLLNYYIHIGILLYSSLHRIYSMLSYIKNNTARETVCIMQR